MRIFTFFVITLLYSLFVSVPNLAAQEDAKVEMVLTNILTKYIQPRYESLHTNSLKLRTEVERLCTSPSPENLSQAQSAFYNFTHTWARIEWLRVGPVMSENRLERILFYPDRKSTGLKQVQRVLAKEDQTVINLESISKKSVAVQGLGALEFILFGTDHEMLLSKNEPFRCKFATSIVQNLLVVSKSLSDGWADSSIASKYWIKPSVDNPLFRDEKEALNAVISTIIHGLEAIREVRIGSFLKDESKLDRPKSALMWRSENTVQLIAHGLEGLNDLFNVSGIEEFFAGEGKGIVDAVRFEFNQSIRAAKSLEQPISDILQSEDKRQKLSYLRLAIGFVISRIDTDLSRELGLSAGFSFGDGD